MGILLAVAAWVRPGRPRRIELEGRPLAATPIVCTVMALAVFVDDHFRHLNALALVLAAATIGHVLVRTLLTFRENTSIAARIQTLSVTDPLTHLWNRRRLVTDLEDVFASGTGDPHVLVLYDLNGFKRFNDLFGHPAGDSLLARLAGEARRRRRATPVRATASAETSSASSPRCRKASWRRSSMRPQLRSARSGKASR